MSAAAGLAAAKRRRGNTTRSFSNEVIFEQENKSEPEPIGVGPLILRHDKHLHYLNNAVGELYGIVDNIHVENQTVDNTAQYENKISQLTSALRTLSSKYDEQSKHVEKLELIVNKLIEDVNQHSVQLAQDSESNTDSTTEEG